MLGILGVAAKALPFVGPELKRAANRIKAGQSPIATKKAPRPEVVQDKAVPVEVQVENVRQGKREAERAIGADEKVLGMSKNVAVIGAVVGAVLLIVVLFVVARRS